MIRNAFFSILFLMVLSDLTHYAQEVNFGLRDVVNISNVVFINTGHVL